MSKRDNIIELRGLELGYPGRCLLSGGDASFRRGEFAALIGRNGTGKSTLLRTMANLSKPLGGDVLVCGQPVSGFTARRAASLISFVSTDEVRVPGLKVFDLVGLGRSLYTNWVGTLSDGDAAVVRRSLELVGMSGFGDKDVDTLSDGERQRVMIARALAQDTPVLLLDEPTAFLDIPNRYQICLLLRRLAREEGKCVVFSTHDLNVALEICDTIVMLDGGGLVSGTPRELSDSGVIAQLFRGTDLIFDPSDGSVGLK